MELKLLNDQGQAASNVAAPDTIFGRDYNEALIHQVVVAYQANARSGNRKQKDREEVHHDQEAMASKRYGPCSCWYVVVAAVAWGWSHIPEFTRRKLLA